MKARLLLATLIVTTTTTALAQSRNPKTVPLEFVQALSSVSPFSTSHDPDVLVGMLADSIRGKVPLPPNARVIGSIDFHTSSTNAIAVPGEPKPCSRRSSMRSPRRAGAGRSSRGETGPASSRTDQT